MDELAPLIEWLKSGFDKSSLSGWVLVVLFAGMWWRGLPAILDSLTKRSDAEAKKLKEEREETRKEMERLHSLHVECEDRVKKLGEYYDKRLAAAFERIDELRCSQQAQAERHQKDMAEAMEKIAGLTAAKAQQQVSTAHLLSNALPDNEGVRLAELAAKASKAMERK